jgi:murein DD-endopeptidase MepM/ murein hydrolase activator NlpD
LYAHLSVLGHQAERHQGGVIGAMGSTGIPAAHFEMLNDAYGKVNLELPPPP